MLAALDPRIYRHLAFYQFHLCAQAADIPSASGEDGRFELMPPGTAILNWIDRPLIANARLTANSYLQSKLQPRSNSMVLLVGSYGILAFGRDQRRYESIKTQSWAFIEPEAS
jgi:hypothetical protein